ncbi:solute carrier family 2, facilitated glucose transporter member 11-like isoform X2 [Hypanus sabinus]|nr:solute carrier family 2, facilitated glucose transporter member 11-like isoform X2 [Hypanus sabinus]
MFVQKFINETWIERYNTQLENRVITFFWTLIVATYSVGGLVGALIAGPMAVIFGRRNSLLLSNVFVLVGALLMGLSRTAKSFEMIIIGRFFSGVNSGVGFNINPLYLGESAPKEIRGTVALSFAPFTAGGLVVGQFIGLREILGSDEWWPLLLASCAVPALIQLAMLPWCPESPRYLLIDRKDKNSCMKALKRLHGNIDITAEMDEMLEEQAVLEGQSTKRIWELFQDGAVRWQMIITFLLGSAFQLCGNDAMYYYAVYVFRAAGIPDERIQYVTIGTGCCEFTTSLTSNLFIDRTGRKVLLMGGYSLMATCGILFTISLTLQDKISWAPFLSMACIFASILGFGIGPAGVSAVIPMEIFDQTARPAAYMIIGSLFWINLIIVGLAFPFLVAQFKSAPSTFPHTLWRIEDSPSHHSIEDSPSHHSIEDSPSHHCIEDSPSHHSIEDSPSHHSIEDSPSHHSIEDSPSCHSIEDSPSHWQLVTQCHTLSH